MHHGLWVSVAAFVVAGGLGASLLLRPAGNRAVGVREVPAVPALAGRAAAEATPKVSTPAMSPTGLKTPAEDGEAQPPSKVEPPVSKEQRQFEQEQKYENDAPPDRRATEVQRELDTELRRALVAGARLERVDCRKATCRADVIFPSLDANKESLQELMAPMESPFGRFGFNARHEKGDDGSIKTTLFVNL
jgi:hypothetical protein